MPLGTSWYYKPTNSVNYPSYTTQLGPHTKPTARGTEAVILSARRPNINRESLERLSRPTFSSTLRYDSPRMSFTHRNRYVSVDGHYVWSKMAFFEDCYRCSYTREGSMKSSTKL